MSSEPGTSPVSDEAILRQLLAREEKGLSQLYAKYGHAIYGLVFNILREHGAAEEVTQDSFLKIWKKAGSFDPEKGSFPGWIFQIARRSAIDRVRLKRFQRQTQTIEDAAPNLGEDPVNPETIGLKDLVEDLSLEQRSIVELIYFRGYTQSETAQALDLPLGTVKTRLYAAIRKLGQLFMR